ncbi:hypothetical protein AVEN_23065-1 [Araneus ventricosus]|uniref:Uncharacterized protein n=1 Tax=Araneus ventricosus TaxID=182803 RepID=A0A4Y2IPX0_ARAVE|nr:hypothetical protein AVEN_23065-1 [Araneus ventricosus]
MMPESLWLPEGCTYMFFPAHRSLREACENTTEITQLEDSIEDQNKKSLSINEFTNENTEYLHLELDKTSSNKQKLKWSSLAFKKLLTHLCLSESSLDVSEVPYQANCKHSIPPQRLYQIKQFPVNMLGPWIHEVVSIPVQVHPPDRIGNQTHQTRQLVSSHQQFNGGVGGPRRGVKLCVVQSTTVHEWDIGSESPYQ